MDFLYVLIGFILCFVGFVYLNDPIRKYSHIPGPQRKSFIKGNNDELSPNPSSVHKVWAHKYGPIYKCFVGLYPVVYISSPELIREVFITKFDGWVNRAFHPGFISESKSIMLAKGPVWKKLRRTITPAFNTIHLKAMMPMMVKNTDSFVDLLDNYTKTGDQLEVDKAFSQIALQIIASTAFGENLSIQNSSNFEFLQAISAFMKAPSQKFLDLMSYLPNLARMSLYALVKKFPPKSVLSRFEGQKFVRNKLLDMVKKKKSIQNSEEDNFISALLNCVDKETGESLTDREIADTSGFFFVAGHDTTKHLLSTIVYTTTQHPHILAKIVEEIDKFFPNNTVPTDLEDLKHLEYISMVINEALRMYPPAPFVSRQNDVDDEIGGYFIPAHTSVVVPVLGLHMDPKIWGEDAETFRPERWLDPPKDQLSFMSFGAGNRNCVGMRFALIEAKILVSRVFQRFRFELVEGKNKIPLVVEDGLITSRIQNGLWVKVFPRG